MKDHYLKTAQCNSCDATIVFLKTARGSNMPVDADTVTEGDTEYDAKVHTSHFETCPNADKHRKRSK